MGDTRAPAPMIVAGTATPNAPDFSALALAHLAQRGDAFRQHVRDYLDRPGEGPLAELVADLQRFRNTLVLLERTGVVFVTEELLSLLESRREGTPMSEEAFAGVLVGAGERLGDHVARLGRGACGEGALSLLPLVNDSRACRGAPLLSAALLLSAGIALPHAHGPRRAELDPSGADALPNGDAAASFAAAGVALRAALASERRGRTGSRSMPGPLLSEVSRERIECVRRSCDAPALAHLQVLFAALGAVVDGVGEDVLEDGAAIGDLFDRVARWLEEATGENVPSLPRELCRDLLYYVALIDPQERPQVAALHERFELGRIRSALEAVPRGEAGTSIGPHLAGAIRDSIDVETSALRQWLDQAPTAADHPRVLRLRERLAQMEPVLTLLGAREARSWLRRINESLETLTGEAPVGSAERLMLAESLLRLDRALDESAGPEPDVVLPGNLSALPEGRADSARARIVDEAATRCLEEARRRLAVIGESLDAPRLVGAPAGDAELQLVERALSVLALVEIVPLLRGLRAASARIEVGSPPALRDALATLLASLDFYLGCVMRPDEEGSRRLLRSAEEALSRLQSRLPSAVGDERDERAVPVPSTSPSTARAAAIAREVLSREVGAAPRKIAPAPVVDSGDDTAALESGEGGTAARQALSCMDTIGELLMAGETEGVAVTPLRHAFDALAGIEAAGRADAMHALAAAAISLLDRVAAARGQSARLRPGELAPLEEAHGVLPQLIERLHGASERVRGFEALLEELRHTAVESAESARGEDDESTAIALDSTLQGVFQRECAMHIDTLERAVAAASVGLERRADADTQERTSSPLPSDALLRALHTLSGSAQTVEAHDIVAVVQPLQRAALARQRIGLSFDEREIRFTGELVAVLRSRLHARESGEAVDPFVHDVEARLPAFVERALHERDGARLEDVRLDDEPGHDGTARGEWSSSVPDLASVFDEEARELLARVQEAVESGGPVEAATDRALGHLHTLKGSARMAWHDAVAERAHALEGEVQALRDGEARRSALAAGRRELQRLLLDASSAATPSSPSASDGPHPSASVAPRRPVPSEGNETAAIPTTTFESLMTLATDVTVSQARLSDDMARVREACRDLESAAGRWRRLPQEGAAQEARLLDTPAAREMLADLDTARRDLSDALRLADVEQQHASRAASSLQQMLVRTRLVRVEDLRSRLAETVRDAAEDTGRQVRFVLDGGEVTLDGALCRQLRAPLEHLVRNAVVHGIESPDDRRRAGKEAIGTVRLSAAVDGTDIVLVVEDDGGGVDREAVGRRREAAGREAIETVDALQDVLCEAGFTTLERASAVGGRGLGLSAVSETLTRLDGRLHIGTRPGLGTAVTCRLRQRIVVVQVVLVRCSRRLYALPVGVITRVDEKRSEGGGRAGHEPLIDRPGVPSMNAVALDVDVFGDSPASPASPGPLPDGRLPDRLSLLSLLGGVSVPAGREEGETDDTGSHEDGSAELVLDLGAESLVLEVDRVVGYRELLVQPLGPQLTTLQRFSGGSVLPDGRQVLLVEPARLIGQWRKMAGSSAPRSRPDPETMRPVALVVDDSITLRVAAAGMLERNGVESREARDGVEALDGLSRALPDLMIVDLDMPRLGGFDLIRRVRERLGERAPPVIVISSRDGAEDHERARVLGVVRYLTKPYTEPDLREALLASGLRLPDLTIA